MEIALSRFLGPDDVITPISPEDEVLRAEVGGRPPQNYVGFDKHMPVSAIKALVPDWNKYFKFTIERNPWDLAVSAYWWNSRLYEYPRSFRRFLFSRVLRKYSNWPLYTIDGDVAVDSVIRYDDLPSGIANVSEHLGLPNFSLPRAKSSYRPAIDTLSMYKQLDRWRVAHVFRREIAAFDWTFGEATL